MYASYIEKHWFFLEDVSKTFFLYSSSFHIFFRHSNEHFNHMNTIADEGFNFWRMLYTHEQWGFFNLRHLQTCVLDGHLISEDLWSGVSQWYWHCLFLSWLGFEHLPLYEYSNASINFAAAAVLWFVVSAMCTFFSLFFFMIYSYMAFCNKETISFINP